MISVKNQGMEYEIAGLNCLVTKKKIKNLYIRIRETDGKVLVNVPTYISDKKIREFVLSHEMWIHEKQQEVLVREKRQEYQYISGERHLLWGKEYELLVERSMKKPLTELRNREGNTYIYMRVAAKSTEVERRKQLDKWYQQQIQKVLPELQEKYHTIVGKEVAEWTFRRMKTRWGSCHIQKKKICLNIQLAEKPPICLEYVVVHEMTHLHEPSHNKRFWQLVGTFFPEYRLGKELLRRFS